MTIYLYDARYNLKTATDYDKLSKLFGMKKNTLMSYKSKMAKLKGFFYIIDDNTSLKEIRELYSGFKIKDEVWKTVEGSNGLYMISNYGRFKKKYKSFPDGKFILPYFRTKTHARHGRSQFIKVVFKNELKEYIVSRLVAYHFVEIPSKYKSYSYDELVVYHKNEIQYDNYHLNLEYLNKSELSKKVAHKGSRGNPIAAIDITTDKVIGVYKSTREVEKNLPINRQSVLDSIKQKYNTRIVGNRYMFVRINDDTFRVDGKLYYVPL